jgi:prevent-host-death family protein
MPTVNVHEAKTQLSKLILAAEAGEEVVIARKGVPAVRLVPVRPQSPVPLRRGGWLQGEVVIHDPDWWKPDDDLTSLFEDGDPNFPDPLQK